MNTYADRKESLKNDRMENAWYWAAQARGWMVDGPNAGLGGTYYVEVRAGAPVIVLDESWSEHNANVLCNSLAEYGFPDVDVKQMRDGGFRLFMEPSEDRLSSRYVAEWREWEPETDFSETMVASPER